MLTPSQFTAPLPSATIDGVEVPVRGLTVAGFESLLAFRTATRAQDEAGILAHLVACAQDAMPSLDVATIKRQPPAFLVAVVGVASGRADEMLAAIEAQAGNGDGETNAPASPTQIPSVP